LFSVICVVSHCKLPFKGRIMIKMILCVLILVGMIRAGAQEPIFNGGFELGGAGYKCVRYIRPDTNPDLKYLPVVLDDKTFMTGKAALRIPNPYAEAIEFSSEEFWLEPAREYTLTVNAKTSAAKYPMRVSVVSVKDKWSVHINETVDLGTGWKNFSFKFKSSDDRSFDYYHVRILFGQKDTPADVWFDDFSISAADGKRAGLEKFDLEGEVINSLIYVKGGKSKPVSASLRVINNTVKQLADDVEIKIVNKTTGQSFGNTMLRLNLEPRKIKEFLLNVPEDIPLGAYEIVVDAKNKNSRIIRGQFAVIGEYKAEPVNLDRDFVVGLNGSVEIITPSWVPGIFARDDIADGIKSSFSLDQEYSLYARMGCRLMRLWGPGAVRWRKMEPREGEYDFSPLELNLKVNEKYAMQILPVLGNMDFLDPQAKREYGLGSLPAWLIKKSETVRSFPLEHKYKNGLIHLPPLECWKKYVNRIAEQFAGRITHYEIMNEPNLIFDDSAVYVKYLKEAYDVLSQDKYKSRVVGICVTGDLGGSPSSFLGSCLKNGALSYCDIVSFHPYSSRELSSATPADKQIVNMKKLTVKYGGSERALWNSELYYLKGKDSQNFEASSFEPYYVARRFLTDLGEGVKQSIAIPATCVWDSLSLKNQHNQSVKNGLYPSETYVVYNALARYFQGSVPVEKIRLKPDSICYVYKRKAKYIAAIWNYRNAKDMVLVLGNNTHNVEQLDIFGNVSPLNTDRIKVGLSPVYLKVSEALTSEENIANANKSLVDALKKSKLVFAQPVALAAKGKVFSDAGTLVMAVGAENYSGSVVNAVINFGGRDIALDFAAKEKKTVYLPNFKINNSRLVTVRVKSNGKESDFVVKPEIVSPVYDVLSSVSSDFIPLTNKQGKGSAEFGARFKVEVKEDDLVLSFAVKDSTPSGPAGNKQYWEKDSIELFFDVAPFSLPLDSGKNEIRQYTGRAFVLPYAEDKINFRAWKCGSSGDFRTTSFKCRLKLEDNGYSAILSLPLSVLNLKKPLSGKSIGLDIKVNNATKDARSSESLSWSAAGDSHKNRYSYGIINFK